MTSFGGHTLQDRIAEKHKKEAERLAESHIPIAPLKPHGPHNIVLHTSESRKLKKNCYINTEKLILVKLSVLQSYGSGTKQTQSHWAKRLQKSSLKILQRACLKNGDYQITLYPTFQALKPSLGVGRAVADDLSLRRVDMVSEIRSFGPVQHPRSSVKRPLLPSAGARHYSYASTTVPKAASQLSKSYHPARLYGRGGYGTVNGSRQSLPRYRSDRVSSRLNRRYSEYYYSHSSESPLTQDASGSLAYLRWVLYYLACILLWILRAGLATAKHVPWRQMLPWLFVLCMYAGIGCAIDMLWVKVKHTFQG